MRLPAMLLFLLRALSSPLRGTDTVRLSEIMARNQDTVKDAKACHVLRWRQPQRKQ